MTPIGSDRRSGEAVGREPSSEKCQLAGATACAAAGCRAADGCGLKDVDQLLWAHGLMEEPAGSGAFCGGYATAPGDIGRAHLRRCGIGGGGAQQREQATAVEIAET